MDVAEAVGRRISVRAFRPDPVPGDTVREILQATQRAPSGGNLQPWKVYALAGEPLATLKALAAERMAAGDEKPEYAVYPADLGEPYRSRQFALGEDMYATLGLAREDKPGRMRHILRNLQFYGAPVGLFFCIERRMGPPQWADVGMYMQSVMLLAVERGLDTCAQEFWAVLPKTVGEFIGLGEHEMLFSGMALGYRDETAPVNTLRTRREPFEAFAEMRGF